MDYVNLGRTEESRPMRIYERLRVFVSSSMDELAEERSHVKAALDELEVDAWVFEQDAGARTQTVQQTFLEEVEAADLYIALFWRKLGGYTQQEYEQAKKLGKDCLIYEKRSGIEGQRDPGLQEFLDRLGAVETGHTVQWFEGPEELGDLVKTDVARWQTRRVRERSRPRIEKGLAPAEAADRRLHLSLLDNVRRSWIEGVLEQSIHCAALEIDKEVRPEATENPWQGVLELPDQTARQLPRGQGMIDLFDEVGRSLLALGAPGSGKTVTLLTLARDLVRRAEQDPGEPVPVVFNLSSWGGAPLAEWLAEELKSKYQIPRRFARRWLEEHRLLPLLDGLDEVRPERRAACVEAINAFVEELGVPGLAVCSRLEDYTALPVRLKLGGAVCLEPLGPERLTEHFERAGPELAGLRAALEHDPELRSLAETPLMLDVMSVAYRGADAREVTAEPSDDPAEPSAEPSAPPARSRRLFDAYVERTLGRRGQEERYPPERTAAWLGWLARGMTRANRSIFLIEELQPSWLGPARRWLYALGAWWVTGLVLGLATALAMAAAERDSAPGIPWTWVMTGAMAAATLLGAVDGLRLGGAAGWAARVLRIFKLGVLGVLGLAFFLLVLLIAVTWLAYVVQMDDPRLHLFFAPLGAASVFLLALVLRRRRRRADDDVATVENLGWSWRRFAVALALAGLVPAALTWAWASHGRETGAELWNAADGELVAALDGHSGHVWGAFSPDGSRVATVGWDSPPRLWQATDAALVAVLELGGRERLPGLNGFSPDGQRLLTRADGALRLWNARNGELVADLGRFWRLGRFSPDGRRIVSDTQDRDRVSLWHGRDGTLIAVLDAPKLETEETRFGPDGRRLVTRDREGSRCRLWDAEDGQLVAVLEGHARLVLEMVFSDDGESLVTASRDGTARLWDGRTGAPVAVLEGHGESVRVAAFSPDGSRLATGSNDGTARLWDARSGAPLAVLEGPEAFARTALFSPGGGLLLTAFARGVNELKQLPPDTPALVARLWNVDDGSEIAVLEGHPESLESAVFSPDGARLLTTSEDKKVLIWDPATGAAVGEFPAGSRRLKGWSERIHVFDAGEIQTWSTRDGSLLSSFETDLPRDRSLSLGPDGSLLLATTQARDFRGLAWLWLALGVSVAAIRGLERSPRKEKALPNEGIRLSARNALVLAPLGGLIAVLILALLVLRFELAVLLDATYWPGLAANFVFFAVLTALGLGGLDVLRHAVLRLILASDRAPLRFAAFLDHAADKILLRKVGGGYIFIHRLLLEHFAAEPRPRAPAPT